MSNKTWTLEEVTARREAGDSLVTHGGWCCSTTTGTGINGAQINLHRVAMDDDGRWTSRTAETDPRDREIFPTTEAAELYALNRGCLVWYRDSKAISDLARQDRAGEVDDSYARTGDAEDTIRRWREAGQSAGDRNLVELIDRVGVTVAASLYETARMRAAL